MHSIPPRVYFQDNISDSALGVTKWANTKFCTYRGLGLAVIIRAEKQREKKIKNKKTKRSNILSVALSTYITVGQDVCNR